MTNKDNKKIFAENLSYYMKCSGRSQREVANVVGVGYSTFNDWIKGKKYPRIDKFEILANYFGIQKSDLIEEKLSEEKEKDNDILANIIVRMRSDEEFSSIVESIYAMNPSQLKGIKQMLNTLQTFAK